MPTNQKLLRLLRKTHLYFGLFISPALLFFAFTGAVQTLSLHEAAGSDYKPPAWLAELGQLHKKQTTSLPVRRGLVLSQPSAASDGAHGEGGARVGRSHDDGGSAPGASVPRPSPLSAAPASPPPMTLAGKQKQHLPMKIFFLLVSLGLFTSTLTGIYMAYKFARGPVLVTSILLLGIALPLLLLRS